MLQDQHCNSLFKFTRISILYHEIVYLPKLPLKLVLSSKKKKKSSDVPNFL